ncbi:MAG: alpha/beta fold hydrolase [Alphaproteobacteria bacterium]|nr:alpha/beta fold hydrolase [Alphaproteobacteria bacterium]
MTDGHVETGGNRFFYRWEGPADSPVVMMAHAMGTSHRIWDRQVPALAGRYRLLLYDWRGHGASEAPEGPYSLDGFVSDAVGVMDALGIGEVVFVGISTGGMIAQGVAIGHPDRVRAAALCNTMARATPWYRQWVVERQAVVRASGMAPVWDMTHKLWFSDAFADAAGPDYAAIRDIFNATDITGYLAGTSAVAELDYLDRLDRISCPVLVLGAGDDPVTPPARAEELRDGIAGAELVMLPGLRHFSNVEAPEAFNAPLLSFLDRVTSPPR